MQEQKDRVQVKIQLKRKHTLNSGQDTEKLLIDLNQWKFFQKGTDHYIFQNINSKSDLRAMLIMFEKVKDEYPLQNQLQSRYKALLRQHKLYQYVLEKKQLTISEDDFGKFEKFLQDNNCKYANHKRLWITNNLFREQEWDVFVQFKIKSPLPEIYYYSDVQNIAKQLSIDFIQVKNFLKNSDFVQKTKWYKKNFLETQNQTHQNPFQMFGICDDTIPDYCHTKLFKKFPDHVEFDYGTINQDIHNFLKKQQLLEQLYKLQCIFVGPVPKVCSEDIKNYKLDQNIQLSLQNCDKKSLEYRSIKLSQLKQKMIKEDCLCKDQENKQNKIQQIFRFLVSLTWKDVSLYYRYNIKSKAHDIIIIDYQLKPLRKIEDNRLKQSLYLKQYLKKNLQKQINK